MRNAKPFTTLLALLLIATGATLTWQGVHYASALSGLGSVSGGSVSGSAMAGMFVLLAGIALLALCALRSRSSAAD